MWQSVVFAILGLGLLASLAAVVRFQSDEPAPTKKPHPIRLTLFMLIGAGFASCSTGISGGRGQDDPTVWERVMPLIYAMCGALGGMTTELFVRWGQRD
jgi:hypothetical protein